MIERLRGAVGRATGAVGRLAATARRAGRVIGRATRYGARMALERRRRLRAPGAVLAGAVLGVLAAARGACWPARRAPLAGRVLAGRVIVSPSSSRSPSGAPARLWEACGAVAGRRTMSTAARVRLEPGRAGCRGAGLGATECARECATARESGRRGSSHRGLYQPLCRPR